MKISPILYLLLFVSIISFAITGSTGCAQIGAPTGGPKDTLPPRLVNASPRINSTSFRGNKITLTFNEYVQVGDVQNNVLVSPFQKVNPTIDFKLKTVTVKLKDSLLPNTTYSINFGSAISDVNESNPLKDFTYVFSTGEHIDTFNLSGRVILAETGGADSTQIAMLYRNTDDSAVQKKQPDYIARLNGKGEFNFPNLPPGKFKVYALKDGDGSKTYNAKVETFAFADAPVVVSANTPPVLLYAYAESKEKKRGPVSAVTKNIDKKLKYISPLSQQNQDLLIPLELTFSKPLKKFDPKGIILTDTNYKPIPGSLPALDSTGKKIVLAVNWKPETKYRLVLNANALADSAGNTLAKTDTIRFTTRKEADYGRLVLRFSNLDLATSPVLQFVQGDEIIKSVILTATEWSSTLFPPGEYDIRILYDANKNGKWDPGSFSRKLQPEKVITLPQKLSIKADWDNERDIKL